MEHGSPSNQFMEYPATVEARPETIHFQDAMIKPIRPTEALPVPAPSALPSPACPVDNHIFEEYV
jgi:hypothetical protein